MAEIAIKDAFAQHKAFIPFITCGDPDLETTEKIVVKMEQAGADLVELGIPFSDPTAEGPVIQGANLRALTGGVTTDKIFDMVKNLRTKVSIPMVFIFLRHGKIHDECKSLWRTGPYPSGCAL